MRALYGLALAWTTFACSAGTALAAPDFTWSGAAPANTRGWSSAANWGGTAPTNAGIGALTFPALGGSGCSACYQSNNDIAAGLGVERLSIVDNDGDYQIGGQGITLGSGGLQAAPRSGASGGNVALALPITLGAAQTWSLTGGSGVGLANLNILNGISGGSDALGLTVGSSMGTFLSGDNEVGSVTITGADSSDKGSSAAANGVVGLTGSLNGTDENPVGVGEAAFRTSANASAGPLTLTGGELIVGSPSVGTLTTPSATLDGQSDVTFAVTGGGTTAGSDYAQLSSSGTVSLNGAHLALSIPGSGSSCPSLNVGSVDTLISTTGTLSGTFNVAGGDVMTARCEPTGAPEYFRIDYHETGSPQTVTATVVSSAPTTTTLSVSPTSADTNQPVTLTATVGAGSAQTLSGTVTFLAGGSTIPNSPCQGVGLDPTTHIATCQTSFAAASSPVSLTAAFTPASGSGLSASSSAPSSFNVGLDPTSTELSSSGAGVGFQVAAADPSSLASAPRPTGFVELFADGAPLQCEDSAGNVSATVGPLTFGAGGCSLKTANWTSPLAPGPHAITAMYLGDANFAASTSPSVTMIVLAGAPGGAPFSGGAVVPAQTSAAPVTPAQIAAALARVRSPGTTVNIRSLLASRGCTLTFPAPSGGVLKLAWYQVPPGAHVAAAKAKRRPVLVATGAVSIARAGSAKLVMKLTTAGTRQLRRARKSLKLTSKASFTPASASKTAATPTTTLATFTVRR